MVQRWTKRRSAGPAALLAVLAMLALATPHPVLAGEPIRQDLWGANGMVYSLVTSGNTLYIAGMFTRVGPNTGPGVPLDSATGLPLATYPKLTGYPAAIVDAVVADGSGGWYIGGLFDHVGGVPRQNIAHILPDYSVDPAWNPGADNQVMALAVSGSTVYAGGLFTSIGGQLRNRIAALDATTGLITTWNPDSSAVVNALAVSGNTVYAGGGFSNIGGRARPYIAALDVTTGLAADWNQLAIGGVNALVVSGDGNTVYAGGGFAWIGGSARSRIAALDTATGDATAWNPNADNDVFTLALSADGNTVYAGGRFANIGGQARNRIAALDANANTNNATDWNPDASTAFSHAVYALTVSGGIVYAGGEFTSIGGEPRNYLAALDASANTNNATAWDPNPDAMVMALAASGSTVYAGGGFAIMGGVTRNRIAALDLTTGQATDWDPDANSTVSTLAMSGSTVYAGGSFTTIGGQPRNRIAALDATTNTNNATDWDPNANSTVSTLVVSGGTVYAGGYFANIGGEPRNRIAALDASTDTNNATDWNPDADAWVRTLAVGEGTVYAGGTFANIGGQTRNYIAALDATTGDATPWNANAVGTLDDPSVRVVAVTGGTVYAGGRFVGIGGQTRNYIAALDATTGDATPWDPNADASARAILPSGGTVYAGGGFTNIGGQARNYIAALDASTGQSTAWDPNANGTVYALALDGETLYAGGSFRSVSNQPASGLVGIPTLVPGTIIIEKETRPAGGAGFGFTQDVDATGDFTLNDGLDKTFLEVAPGQYTVAEHDPLVQPGGYDLTGLVCEDSDPQGLDSTTNLGSRTATVNLDPGETVTCTFTNTERGTAILVKRTLPPGSEQPFPFDGLFDVDLEDGDMTRQRVRPGSHTVTELVPKGWELTDITCDDDNSSGDLGNATATFRVHAGEEVKCTFTNTQRGTITVVKQTTPAGASQAFPFSGAIDAELEDGESASEEVKPGTYRVTEAVPDGWHLTSLTCNDRDSTGEVASATATFKVDPGEEVTCTFANTRDDVTNPPGTLVVAQETVPAGDRTLFPYTGDVAGQIRDGQRLVRGGLQAGIYTSQQLVPEGWALKSIICDDGESTGDLVTATAIFRLQDGETVTCTFTDARLYGLYVPLVLRNGR